MRNLYLILFFLVFPYVIYAQVATISGRVLDNKNLPIEYASLELFSAKDSTLVTGGISNSKGLFQLKKIPKGNYYLRIKFMGFNDKIISAILVSETQSKVRLKDIKLEPSSIKMDEVVVSATKSSVQNKLDKK